VAQSFEPSRASSIPSARTDSAMVFCCLFDSRPKDELTSVCCGTSAHSQAVEGLSEMVSAYRKIAQLTLPPGAAMVFAKLRRDMTDLEALISEATFPESRPWRSPLAQEQHEWDKIYPNGGILLRRQLCSASMGDQDWFLGGLFISDVGIAFDTGNSADEAGRLQTGFITWKDIVALHKSGPETEISICLASGSKNFSQLRLQLTISSDAEWIEEFWKLQAHAADVHVDDDQPPAQLEKAVEQCIGNQSPKSGAEVQRPVLLHQLSRSASVEAKAAPEAPEVSGSPGVHRSLSLNSKLSGVYNEAPGGRKPFHLPQGETPVGSDNLPAMDISSICKKLQSENWLCKFLQESKQAHSISATPWSESKQAPGVMVRKATFTLPVPQDFPRAVTRLVNLPTETKVTAVFRMHPQDGQLLFTVQFCSHDIPYGENFRVHETVLFKTSPNNGVATEQWVEVMWIASLPWTHGILKSIIEQKSKADGLGTRVVNAIKKSAA